jgi:hypothetical protein
VCPPTNREEIVADQVSISPALTLEEWVQFGESKAFFDMLAAGRRPYGPERRFNDDQKLHALAALALHRHPAGFTQAELTALDTTAHLYERRRGPGDIELGAALRTLHSKIAALLPPHGVRIPSPE